MSAPSARARSMANTRAAARVATPRSRPGGIDIAKFAGEVSGNYARGLGQVSSEVGKAVGAAQQRVMGPSPIRTAMNIPDSQNPLKKILRGSR